MEEIILYYCTNTQIKKWSDFEKAILFICTKDGFIPVAAKHKDLKFTDFEFAYKLSERLREQHRQYVEIMMNP